MLEVFDLFLVDLPIAMFMRLGHAKLSDILKISKLLTRVALLFGLHDVVLDVLLCSLLDLATVELACHYLGHAGCCIFSDALDVVGQVIEP